MPLDMPMGQCPEGSEFSPATGRCVPTSAGMLARRMQELKAALRAGDNAGTGVGGGESLAPPGSTPFGDTGGGGLRGDADPTGGKKYRIPRNEGESFDSYRKRLDSSK